MLTYRLQKVVDGFVYDVVVNNLDFGYIQKAYPASLGWHAVTPSGEFSDPFKTEQDAINHLLHKAHEESL